jgi:hypothetical protein
MVDREGPTVKDPGLEVSLFRRHEGESSTG